MALKLAATAGNVAGPIISNRTFGLDQVIVTPLDESYVGLVVVAVPEDKVCGVWRVECGGGAAISVNPAFTTVKGTAGKYNCYFEDGYLKFQNKVAGGKTLRISVFGVEPVME